MESIIRSARALVDIEADIRARKRNITLDVLAIGRDLTDAKQQLGHGEWLPWLRKMEFGERTAENWMRLAREIPAESSLAALPYTKALALLQAPAEDREQLAAEAGDKSAAEIKRLAEEARAEKEKRQRAEQQFQEAADATYRAERESTALRRQLDDLVNNPATVEVTPDDYDDLKDAVQRLRDENEELMGAIEEAEKRASAAWEGGAAHQDKRADAMELLSATADFLARTERMPQMAQELRELPDHDIRSMEISVGTIKNWVTQMDAALSRARLRVAGGEGAIV